MKRINILKITHLLWLLLMLNGAVVAQNMRTFPNLSRLPGPVVRTILQDEEGYIWYGTTESGLVRDNGYQINTFVGDKFSNFNRIDLFINQMCLTRHHEILFSTPSGAWLLDKHTYRMERLDSVVTTNKNINSLAVDSLDDSYWLTAGNVVYHLSRERHLIRTYDITMNGTMPKELSLYCDSKGRLWLTMNEGGMRFYDRRKDSFEACNWDLEYSPLKMEEDKQHECFWIGTRYGGIVRYEIPKNSLPTQGKITQQPATLPIPGNGGQGLNDSGRGFVFGISLSDNKLWVSALDNLYCYEITDNGKSLRRFDTSKFLPQRSIILLERPSLDKLGNVWVPSFTPNPFIIMPKEEKVERHSIEQMTAKTNFPLIADAVVKDDEGYWLMQGRVGLMYYRISDGLLKSAQLDQPHKWLYSFEMLGRSAKGKGVWVADGRKLWRAWMEGDDIRMECTLEMESYIHCMYETSKGDLILGLDDGIVKVDSTGKQPHCLATRTGHVYGLIQMDNGAIYLLGTDCGFARVADNGQVETLEKDVPYDKIATNGMSIWVSSTEGKVATYDFLAHTLKENWVKSDRMGGLVKRLQVDAYGHVWVLTCLYVNEYNPKNKTFRVFNISDSNIKADYFQDLKAKGKEVSFCGSGGIYTVFSSNALEQESEEAHASVTEVNMDSTSIFLGYGKKHLVVPAKTEHLLLYLSSFDHLNADKVTFAYRMLGKGKEEWLYLPTGLNVLHLTNLSKGKFDLEVKVTNKQGQWSQGEVVLTIEKEPEWWETWWAIMLYILSGAALLVLAVRYYLTRQKRKNIEEMEQRLTDMKFRFFTNMSHELRTPLTLIITPLNSIVNALEQSELKQKLEAILNHAKELLEMINNLLSFRKLEMGEMKLNLRYGELNEFASQACESFRPIYEKKGVTLHFTPNPSPLNFYFDKNIVHHILFNLLSNAHKFTPAGGDVAVKVKKMANGMVMIEVADTGIGISKEDQKHIFDRYYQVGAELNDGTNGSGIGLNMVSEMVALHGGAVKVDSEIGNGAVFTVMLPCKYKDVHSVEKAQVQNAEFKNASRKSEKKEEKENNRFCVLVVDDNDEFRQFVVDELSSEFNVLQAMNGQDGLDIAEAEQVDMVVSDVMMPMMDGFEMCRKLKSNQKTSHICVLLLTARAGQESELQGYQSGADFYITKPFEMEILIGRIRKVETLQREHRQELLQKLENPDVNTLFTSDLENLFVKKIIELLDKNIDKSEYGQEQLCSDLCMSYITAYRKIKSLTGLTPSEFIRNFRLKRAAQLLRSTTKPVTEVAMLVGFSTGSNFTRCFLKEYGMPPSDYRKQKMQK